MDLSVVFLGTGGSVPTARRSTAACSSARGGERILFDCGEGTQRQMQRSAGLVGARRDLPDTLPRRPLPRAAGAAQDLRPARSRTAADDLRPARAAASCSRRCGRIVGRLGYALDARRARAPASAVDRDGYRDRAVPGRAPGRAPRLRAGRGRAARAVRPRGRASASASRRARSSAALQRGESVDGSAGRSPEQVMGESRPGRKIVITGDTAPCEATRVAAHGAELLVHDGELRRRGGRSARPRPALDGGQAATLAREAEVRMLALVHVSSRYHVGAVLRRGPRGVRRPVAPRDFDLVEIPFPERGEPTLDRRTAPGSAERTAQRGSVRRLGRRSRRQPPSPGPPGGSAWRAGGSARRHRAPRSRARRRSWPSVRSRSPQTIWAGYAPAGEALEEEALLLPRSARSRA